MGTNYFVRTHSDGQCDANCRGVDIHLGKSSAGWDFSFRAYPEPVPDAEIVWQVTDFQTWKRLLGLGEIHNEYGAPILREELLALVEAKRGGLSTLYGDDFRDEAGNRFTPQEFS